MPDPWKRLQELIRRRQQGEPVSPGEKYVAELPGVGQGLLDTLRALHGGTLTFDTVSTDPSVYAEYKGNRKQGGRVVFNPRVFGPEAPPLPPHTAPITAVHEAVGHGIYKLDYPQHQSAADEVGRAFVRLTGRDPDLRFTGTRDMFTTGKVRELLDQLKERPDVTTVASPKSRTR